MLSIIIPTINEEENLKILIPQLKGILPEAEIVVVDDNSSDGTREAAERLGAKVLHRKTEKGLSSAVLKGFKKARGDQLIVMDADLSHPPEAVKRIAGMLDDYDVVVGKRTSIEGWQPHRHIISFIGKTLAAPIAPTSDPMSGLFGLHRDVISSSRLNPLGFKILLEILAKGKYEKMGEVEYVFENRRHGESKLSTLVIGQYISHLVKLYSYKLRGLGKMMRVIIIILIIAYAFIVLAYN